jgi:uncharacterized ParB-like nuclease family protein
MKSCPGYDALRVSALWLLVAGAISQAACTTVKTATNATTERVPADVSGFRGAQYFNMSERERLRCERRASQGDILAAKKLVTYHEMVTGDDQQYRHWLVVVARLQNARLSREKHLRKSSGD